MSSKNPAQRLRDIVDNIDAIRDFTARMGPDDFAADRKTVYAVVRALETVSEATRRLPGELKEPYPAIDWTAVAAAGNVYRHEYEGVDTSLVWYTVQHSLRELRMAAAIELEHSLGACD